MENLVNNNLFGNIYKDKKVFITGHTGFKGSWLFKWMEILGAEVKGYSLESSTEPNHFSLLNSQSQSFIGSINDREQMEHELVSFNPEIVFHLAAQPLVRYSYAQPHETYETNVLGTLNLLEACRKANKLEAIICITTDKVYENVESLNGYLETDRLGGYDPYSSSKACAEILISSYRNSFFQMNNNSSGKPVLLSTVRGGNVIGGGDWSEDRLIPDLVRAITENTTIEIRNPKSIRPWQHVLDCLSGYILLGQKLLEGRTEFSGPWNFGPIKNEAITVEEIIQIAKTEWKEFNLMMHASELHETKLLTLNCDKAQKELQWSPVLENDEMFRWTFQWYKSFYHEKISTIDQFTSYFELAKKRNIIWAQ